MDVGRWLKALGLERYEATFRENAVSPEVLHHLTAEDLRELGVTAVGHRRELLVAIAKLQEDAATLPAVGSSIDDHRAQLSTAERRQITVLFCDIVGSTPMSARLDPEELREVLTAYQASVAAEVAGKRGYIARFVGDGVLAYFGWPNADEAHAESAVRAGLAIVGAINRQQLAVRIGSATGLVVTGDLVGVGAAQTVTAVGETPNLAARLQALAKPNTVVVSDPTRSQLGRLFELEDLGLLELKGFDKPIRVWRARRETGAASRSETVYVNARVPLVGRDEELGLLLRRWRTAAAGEGKVVLLSGEPGIGKSRLLAALEEQLAAETHTSLRYFCSPYHQDSPLYPIAAKIEQEAGFATGDSARQRLAKLAAILSPPAPDQDDLTLYARLLLVPLDESSHAAPEQSPQIWKEQTFGALTRRLAGWACQRPVLMVFEDAHWSDPTSIELLDKVIEQVPELPVLLIVSFRPEFAAPWFGRPGVSLMALSRLGRQDAASLAAQVTSLGLLSSSLLDQIINRADGVPLFIEELTKAVLEAPELQTASSALAVPDTLQASLMARLDRLQGGRELAQIGSVIGREFSHEMLNDVAGQPAAALENGLTELVGSELIYRTGTPPNARYTFKHVLVQQAAYESLLRTHRQAFHARVAKVMERLPEEVEHRSHLLVHHATLAGDHELAARACIAAGERSLHIFAREEARRLAERGLTHLDGLPDGEQKVRFHIRLLVIKVHSSRRRGDEGPDLANRLQEAADAAMTLGLHNEAVSALYARSWLHYWSHDTRGASQVSLKAEEASRKADQITRCHQIANTGFCLLDVEQQISRALEMIDEAETIAKTLDVDFVELECARANAVRWKGDLDGAHVHMSRALELTRMRKEHWREVECLISLATINLERQKLPSVEQYCDEIDEIAGRLDHALPPVSAAFRVLAQFSACGEDLLPELDRALTSLRDFDDKAHLAYVLNFAAHDALALGEYSRACTAATEALKAARAMLRTTEIVVATSILARAECADGDRLAAVARLHTLVSECHFETLSARARANLERAAHDVGFALERPPHRQAVHLHESS